MNSEPEGKNNNLISRRITGPALFLILTILYFAVRAPHLFSIPPFTDELCFIRWSQLVSLDFETHKWITFTGAGKQPLFIWITGLLYKYFSDPAGSLRVSSMVFGMFTLWGVVLLCRDLFGARYKWAPYLAGLLYVANPFAVLHETIGVFDPMVSALGVFSFILSYRLVYRENALYTLPLALLLGAALITKAYAVFFLAYPLIFIAESIIRRKKLPGILPAIGAAAAIAFAMGLKHYVNSYPRALYGEAAFLSLKDYFFKSADQLGTIIGLNLKHVWEIYFVYLGLPVIALFAFFIGWAIAKRERGALALIVSVFGAIALQVVLAYTIYSRYLFFTYPLILAASVWALFEAAKIVGERAKDSFKPKVLGTITVMIAAGLIISMHTIVTRGILINPEKAPMDSRDKWQYVRGWPSGYGFPEVVDYLRQESTKGPIDVFAKFQYKAGLVYDGLKIYLDEDPNIRLHLSFWEDQRPLLFFVKDNIILNNRTSQNFDAWEELKPGDLSEFVYYVGNYPKFDPVKFSSINNLIVEKRAYKKPGGKSIIWVYKMYPPQMDPEAKKHPQKQKVQVTLTRPWEGGKLLKN